MAAAAAAPAHSASVIEVNDKKHFDELIAKHEKCVLDFNGVWCVPCKKMAPLFNKLADENKGLTFLTIDVDKCEDVHADYPSAAQVPTFVFLHKGAEVKALTCGGVNEKLIAGVAGLAKL